MFLDALTDESSVTVRQACAAVSCCVNSLLNSEVGSELCSRRFVCNDTLAPKPALYDEDFYSAAFWNKTFVAWCEKYILLHFQFSVLTVVITSQFAWSYRAFTIAENVPEARLWIFKYRWRISSKLQQNICHQTK